MKKYRLGVVAVGIVLAAGAAYGHGGATGIVKERMDLMKTIGKSMKVIAKTAKGDRPFDGHALHQATETIQNHAGGKITRLFPEGSLHHPSEARPEIWQDWSTFESQAAALGDKAQALQDIIKREKRLPPKDFVALAKTCGGCHDRFRKD